MPGDENRRRFRSVATQSQKLARILRNAANTNLEVQMGTGRSAGSTDIGDMLAPLDDVAYLHVEPGSMRISSDEIIAVINLQHVAKLIMIFGGNDYAGSSSDNRRAGRRRKIQTFVKRILAGKGIDAPAEA